MSASILLAVLASGIALSAPLLYAAAGELISETSGVINIEIEGMMLTGAFCGVLASLYSGSVAVGFIVGAGGGLVIALLQGVLCFLVDVNQIVAGIILNILALGATSYGIDAIVGNSVNRFAPTLMPLHIPGLSDVPVLGKLIFQQNIGVLLAFALYVVLWAFLRSKRALSLRAVGDAPRSSAALGLPVVRVRWLALSCCGVLSGIGGAQLTIGTQLGVFTPNITAGVGFIALAAVIFGRWTVVGTLVGVLLFSVVRGLGVYAQVLSFPVPTQVLTALPYIVTVVALAAARRGSQGPRYLGVNFHVA